MFPQPPPLKPCKPLRKFILFNTRNGYAHFIGHHHVAAVAAYILADMAHIDQKLFIDAKKIAAG